MTGRKTGRRSAEQGPAPLTSDETEQARAALRDELEKLRQEAADKVAEAQRNLIAVENGIDTFELETGEHLGWQAYVGLLGAAHQLANEAVFRGGDREAYEQAHRRQILVGRYLRELGHPYLKEFNE